jgi:hypothetical protein
MVRPAQVEERKASGSEVFSGPTYEEQLHGDLRWALNEGSNYFEGGSRVQQALRKVTARLQAMNVRYAVVGGMALFAHGFQRFTEDVDILVSRSDLQLIHQQLSGLGYLPPFAGSKNLRDTELGVKIEFLIAGDYPGDGAPKPVAFPEPGGAAIEKEGILFVKLPRLIEMKLASGMTNVHRGKDFVDVQELISLLNLPRDFRGQLDPYVGAAFDDLWIKARKRYVKVLRMGSALAAVPTFDELMALKPEAGEEFKLMKQAGIVVEVKNGHVWLVTSDPGVASTFDMHDETEMWPD